MRGGNGVRLSDRARPCGCGHWSQQDLDSAPVNTLADIRATLGASGVADAIRRALAAHPTITAAAMGASPCGKSRRASSSGAAPPPARHRSRASLG